MIEVEAVQGCPSTRTTLSRSSGSGESCEALVFLEACRVVILVQSLGLPLLLLERRPASLGLWPCRPDLAIGRARVWVSPSPAERRPDSLTS